MDDHLRDNIYRLKLKMLNERMSTNVNNIQLRSKKDDEDLERDIKIRQLDKELQDAKRKYEKLKSKLRDERMIQKMKIDAPRVTESGGSEQTEVLSKLLEMIAMQQTQIQDMVRSQASLPRRYSDQEVHKVQVEPSRQNTPVLIKVKKTPSYPGNEAQRSLRRLGLAAVFCAIVDCEYQEHTLTLTDKFLFEIKVKEIIATIERIFISPGGEIHTMLTKLNTTQAPNFTILLTRTGTNEELSLAESELNSVIQNLVTKVTGIMPKYGTLGCECRSILAEFLHNQQTFPERYFFQREYDLFQVDSTNVIHKVGALESRLLLIGVFFIRTLVMHDLIKPVEFGVCSSLSLVGKQNFKILASIIVAIYISILGEFIAQRHPNDPRNKANSSVTFVEFEGVLLNDGDVHQILKLVKKSADAAKAEILKWSEMYVMNLKPM